MELFRLMLASSFLICTAAYCYPCVCFSDMVKCVGENVIQFPTIPQEKRKMIKLIRIEDTLIRKLNISGFFNLQEIYTQNNPFLKCDDWISSTEWRLSIQVKGKCSYLLRSTTGWSITTKHDAAITTQETTKMISVTTHPGTSENPKEITSEPKTGISTDFPTSPKSEKTEVTFLTTTLQNVLNTPNTKTSNHPFKSCNENSLTFILLITTCVVLFIILIGISLCFISRLVKERQNDEQEHTSIEMDLFERPQIYAPPIPNEENDYEIPM